MYLSFFFSSIFWVKMNHMNFSCMSKLSFIDLFLVNQSKSLGINTIYGRELMKCSLAWVSLLPQWKWLWSSEKVPTRPPPSTDAMGTVDHRPLFIGKCSCTVSYRHLYSSFKLGFHHSYALRETTCPLLLKCIMTVENIRQLS